MLTYILVLMSLRCILRLKLKFMIFPLDLVPEKKPQVNYLILQLTCFAHLFFLIKSTDRVFYVNTVKEGFSIGQLLAHFSYLKQLLRPLKEIFFNVSLLFYSMLTIYVIGFSLKGYRNPWQVSPFFSVSYLVFVCLVF